MVGGVGGASIHVYIRYTICSTRIHTYTPPIVYTPPHILVYYQHYMVGGVGGALPKRLLRLPKSRRVSLAISGVKSGPIESDKVYRIVYSQQVSMIV
jgi:hypothetical protein